jgi:hypothetical protein
MVNFMSGRPSPQVTPVALFLLVSSHFWHPPIGKLFVWQVLNPSAPICSLPIGQLAFLAPSNWLPGIGKIIALPAFISGDASCTLPIGQLAIFGTLLLVNFLSGRS